MAIQKTLRPILISKDKFVVSLKKEDPSAILSLHRLRGIVRLIRFYFARERKICKHLNRAACLLALLSKDSGASEGLRVRTLLSVHIS